MRFLVKILLCILCSFRFCFYYFCRFFQINDFCLDFPDGELWLDMFKRRVENSLKRDLKMFGLLK